MQQPLPQHDQLAAQQMQQQQQQMVLCPVRVVYETQILVQPGDQIQPNQTLFINPQNPPPWAQTRPVQNQVIYVQQMPGNIMPSLPQHMDQNQLYLHQYPYQQGVQMMPHMVQENRPNTIQMPNLIHQNMLQNYQTNLTSNMSQIQTLPDRTMQQTNYGQLQSNIGANMHLQQQAQLNLASNIVVSRSNETVMNTQNVQSQFNTQKVDVKQAYIGHMNQPPNVGAISRSQPQVLTVNPMQNMPVTSTVQTFAQNIVRPIKTESVASQITPPTYVNAAQNTQITRIRKVTPTTTAVVNKINPTIGIRSVGQTQTYRPIHPRPLQQFRPTLPNYSTIEPLSQANSMPILTQNLMSVNSNVPIQNATSNAMTFIRTDDPNVNRKRKSESPDEIHKKMAAIQVNINTPIKQISEMAKRTETGVNTSPMQKNQMTITPSIMQPNNVKIDIVHPVFNNNMQATNTKNISYLIQNVQQTNQINLVRPAPDPTDAQSNIHQTEGPQNASISEKDKLIRNTVYMQARGRVLTDKEAMTVSTETSVPEAVSNLKEITVTPKKAIIETQTEVKPEIEERPAINKVTNVVKMETNVVKTEEVKTPMAVDEIKDVRKVEVKEEKKERADMKVSLNTTNNKGMFPMERAVKQDYILTHVLDGIVIQESNVAFPIREPLIKRISQSQNQMNKAAKHTIKEDTVKSKEEEATEKENTQFVESNASPEPPSNEEVAQGDNPFSNLTATTVKSWTTQQLSAHLSQQGWEDVASLIMEHELDGDSLYLVSKTQLQTIGVKEEQADIICAFVRS